MSELWWLALNSHTLDVDSQLELSGDGMTTDSPEPSRVIYNPSPQLGLPHGDEE